ncbi:plasmid mobilization protein [Murdochiella massiliensis]|uniref:plasmid mobilization protein n=1 Tax=Murdochiella massiliensis TaxID=1673723 RepID=UPI00082A3A4C|nr:plasmid mobilization relaxosome protein MobC [Murdochiella massiliensis]
MENRTRNNQQIIRLTDEEKNAFWHKRKLARCRNMSLFIRKCVLEKDIYVVDLEPFRKIEGRMANIASNVNQIAKKANSADEIAPESIRAIQAQIDSIGREVLHIHSLLVRQQKVNLEEVDHGHHENSSN